MLKFKIRYNYIFFDNFIVIFGVKIVLRRRLRINQILIKSRQEAYLNFYADEGHLSLKIDSG